MNPVSINQLLNQWPPSVVMTSKALLTRGYYRQLLRQYSLAQWIRSIGSGAYLKLNDPLTLVGALYALQTQLNLPLHLGGLSALEQHGLAHFVAMREEGHEAWLYVTAGAKARLPTWFVQHFSEVQLCNKHLFDSNLGVTSLVVEGLAIQVSSPERAILEALALVPTQLAYEYVATITEHLQLLRPKLLSDLLQHCQSIKVKRLFLHLAHQHQLPVVKGLKLEAVELGTGKLVIATGGYYDPQFQISVPRLTGEDEAGVGRV